MALTQVSTGGIKDGTISNADLDASAAIDGSKVSPDFGSQNITTTGTVTGASLVPSSSTVPTNGVYLPAANSVALSTNSVGRLLISSTGAFGLSGANYGSSGQALISQGPNSPPQWGTAGLSPYTITTTSTSKTLANRERCTVTASGQTITLPGSPSAGDEITVTIAGTFLDTIIARNGSNIMSLAQDMTVDKPNVSVTLYYVDATRGWRII